MGLQVLQRMRSGKRGKSFAALAIALAIGGCSKQEDKPTPVGCKEGPETIEAALARAPARVELGGTPLSECFARNSDSADIQQVGASFVTVATHLSAEAKQSPDGPAALRLGYLVGAARRGAGETQGIHEELMRRIEQELNGVNTTTPSYRRGLRAGRERG
jgi:hypothetical protein